MEKGVKMSRNGAGTYVLPAGQPVVTGTTISSATHNTLATDLANALTTSIATDGQSVVTANIPFAGYKLTGIGAATVNGDALRYENLATLATSAGIQVQTYTAFTTAGTSTAYTLTTAPPAGALVEDQRYQIEWHATSGASPTLARDGLAAKNIMIYDSTGTKIAAPTGSLVAGVKSDVVYDGTDYVILGVISTAVVGTFGAQTIAGLKTFSTYPAFPALGEVCVHTANGYGSTNTKIRRYSTVQVNNGGTDITYADSATLGASFTIGADGVYAVCGDESFTTGSIIGASVNATGADLTTNIAAIGIAKQLFANAIDSSNSFGTGARVKRFTAGDVIRPHHDGVAVGVTNISKFSVTRIS